MSQSRHLILLACALLFLLAVNATWLYLDHAIPAWDNAYYLTNSLLTYDAFTNGGLPGLGHQFLTGMSTKPPLIAAIPIPIYLTLGRHPRAALLMNLLFLMVTLLATYLLARTFSGRRAGLVALCLAGTMPMIYGLSRLYLVECGLTALVTVSLLIVASWDQGSSAWMPPALGLFCGLGLLMKSSFPFFVALPFLWLAFRRGRDMFSGRSIVAFLIPVGVVAGPWYAVNVAAAIGFAVAAGSPEAARIYHTGGLPETGRYLLNVMNCGPTLYFAALPVLAALGLARLGPQARRGILFCVVAAAPLLFLAFSHYRDLRWTSPFFPIFAVLAAILVDGAISRFPSPAMALTGLLLIAGTADMLGASFGLHSEALQGGLLLSPVRFSYVKPPTRAASPYPGLLHQMQAQAPAAGGERPRLVLGSDTPYCNADTIGLAALASHIPIDIATTAYLTAGDLRPLLASASYFAYAEGATDSALNPLGALAVSITANDAHYRQIALTNLPDGSRLHVLAGQPQQPGSANLTGTLVKSGLDAIPVCSVKFSDGIELVGLSLRAAPGGIEARYRWRCLRPLKHDYWAFGHALDSAGKVIGYLDHAILKDTPTTQWEAGDTGVERVIVPLGDAGGLKELRLGVFDKQSGERLTIVSSTFPLADAGTATVSPVR